MSRRPTNNSAGVALFPFLAVLVCTMGSLILLLIVTTKRIRAATIEKARQAALAEITVLDPIPDAPPQLPPDVVEVDENENAIHEWRTQLETLTSERDSARNALTVLERKLVAAQTAVLRSQETAASKKDRLKEARGIQQQAAADRERLQNEITAMREELIASERRLVDAKERQKTARSRFAFIPFDGRNGTTRRPILIECTEQFIRFVPEDIRLTSGDLNGFTAGFNPLLNASRELIHYWDAYDRVHAEEAESESEFANKDLLSHGSSGKEPYVLLLVRPNGAMSFLIAKSLLGQLKIPHGYELLDDNMELEFSTPNPDAKQICQQAIAQTINERDKIMQLVSSNRQLQSEQLQLEPNANAFVPVESSDSPKTPFGTRSSNGVGTKSAASAGSTSGANKSSGGVSEKRIVSSGGKAGGIGVKESGEPATFGDPTGNDGSSDGSDRNTTSSKVSGGPSSLPQRSSSRGGTSEAWTGNGFSRIGTRPESEFVHDERDLNGGGSGSGRTSKANGPSTRSSGNSSNARRLPSTSDFGDEPQEEPLPRRNPSLENDDTKPFPLGRASRGNAGGSAKGGISDGVAGSGSSSKGKSSSSPDAGGTASSGGAETIGPSQPNGTPSANRVVNGQRPSGNGDMRSHKRRYSMTRSGIGLEKAIPIRVWSNRILIGNQFEIPVTAGVRTESLVERVLMALDREQAGWPSAGEGYHWVPTLRYEVAPGGDQVQQRLNTALFELGLASSVTFLDADPDESTKVNRPPTPKKMPQSTSDDAAPSRESSGARAAGTAGTRSATGGVR